MTLGAMDIAIQMCMSSRIVQYQLRLDHASPPLSDQRTSVQYHNSILSACVTMAAGRRGAVPEIFPTISAANLAKVLTKLSYCIDRDRYSCHVATPGAQVGNSYRCLFAFVRIEPDQFPKVDMEVRIQVPVWRMVANISIPRCDVYNSGPQCVSGGLLITAHSDQGKSESIGLVCGRMPDGEMFYIANNYDFILIKFNSFLFKTMRGVVVNIEMMDEATAEQHVPSLLRQMITIQNFEQSWNVRLQLPPKYPGKKYHILAAAVIRSKLDSRLRLLIDKGVADYVLIFDGPGTLSKEMPPCLKTIKNSGHRCVTMSSTFIITIIQDRSNNHPLPFTLTILTSSLKKTDGGFRLGKIDANEGHGDGQLRVSAQGTSTFSNYHSVLRLEDTTRVTIDWEVKILDITHSGSDFGSCQYGGLVLYDPGNAPREPIRVCQNNPSDLSQFTMTFSGEWLYLVYYHHHGYSQGGSVVLEVRSSSEACFDMPAECPDQTKKAKCN